MEAKVGYKEFVHDHFDAPYGPRTQITPSLLVLIMHHASQLLESTPASKQLFATRTCHRLLFVVVSNKVPVKRSH